MTLPDFLRLSHWKKTGLFKFLSSLNLAVLSLLSLAAILAVATVLESLYGMRGAHILVYGTYWFYGVLALLGANVLCAALARYPWKSHQTGFVITHSGILVILFGAWVTQQFGVDGNLPVVEGSADASVVLHPMRLTLFDEQKGSQQVFPIPETALRATGDLLKVQIGNQEVLVTEFLPRARSMRRLKESPIPGIGVPGIELEISSSRFGVIDETLFASKPDGWAEKSLGPAKLLFRRLNDGEEQRRFLRGDPQMMPTSVEQGPGELVLNYHGQEIRASITRAMKKWHRVGSTSLELFVERYLPYAVVENNELVSKSSQPVNPAVQVLLRNPAGTSEKHTVFANFPEFETLHGGARKSPSEKLGVKLRFVASRPGQMGGQGILAFAQSADGKKLLYRSWGAKGDLKNSGEAKPGEPFAIGWMDSTATVRSWLPASVSVEEPVYVEKVAGMSGNFSSAIRVEVRPVHSSSRSPAGGVLARDVAGNFTSSGLDLAGENWVFEGETRSLSSSSGGRYLMRFDREVLRLPFSLWLKKFSIGHDPGTSKAASYQSEVEVRDAQRGVSQTATVSMNAPLHYGGYAFYQASYQMRDGEPPVSVFSVNLDPGRWIKYLGSILLCMGILVMFYMNPHYWGILLGSRHKKKGTP